MKSKVVGYTIFLRENIGTYDDRVYQDRFISHIDSSRKAFKELKALYLDMIFESYELPCSLIMIRHVLKNGDIHNEECAWYALHV